jgi:ubiquinone/menaquinone biosynthesis C-methylase UbiE
MEINQNTGNSFESSKTFFDKRFSENMFALKQAYQKRYHFVLSCLHINPDDIVADIGCAQGGLLLICKQSHIEAYGIDFSHEALKVAKTLGLDNVVCADAQKLPFSGNCFDKILVLQTLEVLQDKTSALEEIKRIANDDATFYFEVRNGSFILRKPAKLISRIFNGIAKQSKPQLLFNEDPSYHQWTEILHLCGYRIIRPLKSPVYLYYENPVQFIKTIVIKLIHFLCPAKYCFTLSFLCNKRR